jgi:hypothetical protein
MVFFGSNEKTASTTEPKKPLQSGFSFTMDIWLLLFLPSRACLR